MSVGHVGLTCCTLDFQEAEPSCSCHLLPLESSLYTRVQPRKVLLTGFQGWRLSRQTLGGSTELFSGDGLPFRKLGSEFFVLSQQPWVRGMSNATETGLEFELGAPWMRSAVSPCAES